MDEKDKKIKVLLIDDDEDDYILTKDLLSEIEGTSYILDWVPSYNKGLKTITSNKHDVCLLDYKLGQYTGLELLREALMSGCRIPIILLTGKGTHEVDIEAMKAGASDYLNKREINAQLLERSIRYAIQHKLAEERIMKMAYYDTLTSLPNRALFHDRLKQTLEHSKRYGGRIALLFLDLDNFKRINDTLEHRVGDMLLKGVAKRLTSYIRKSDTISRQGINASPNTVARLGGDEFIVLLTEVNSMKDAAKVAQRVLRLLSRPFLLDSHEVFITASIGIALYPDDGLDVDTLLKNADTAMYHAKDQGKNNFQFYKESLNATALERLNLENNLRRALERNEFILHYQPRMDIRTGTIVGTEALIRWNHPKRGLIYPKDFISLAEETGIILPLGKWVLKTACEQNKKWQKEISLNTRVAVSLNLSGLQFRQESLIQTIADVLKDSELEPPYLELEITESVIMKHAETTTTMLQKLKNMGVRISMDDFGTGYSSFGYLKRFPIDFIKIDRSFIRDVTHNSEDAAIVKAIIAMAHTLKLRVIAEGVETKEQMEFLKQHGCDEMQGYFLSAPLPAEELLKFLFENHSILK
jgi:diguanylate cyclase (GGDEF)-like protein